MRRGEHTKRCQPVSRWALALALGAVLAIPRVAASGVALSYNLTLSPRPGPVASSGTVAGKFGGIPVTGAYAGSMFEGTLTLTVDGVPLASGTYGCAASACTFTGTVADRHVAGMSMSPGLSAAGWAVCSAFPSPNAWVSAVTAWATAKLGSDRAWRILSAAASADVAQTAGGRERGEGAREPGSAGSGSGGSGMGMGGMH